MMMNDTQFWSIIEKLDKTIPWVEGADWDAICNPAVDALAATSENDITLFFETFAQKLYALDTPQHYRYARDTGLLGLVRLFGRVSGIYFSDRFLYARLHVVGLGRQAYELVLSNPKRFPKNAWFEHLLYIADTAFERVTGREFPRDSSVDFESFSNSAWKTK